MTLMSGRLRRRRPGDLLERDDLVDTWLGRQPQHPLAEDVALDLVGAAPDGDGRRDEEQRQPLVLADEPSQTCDIHGPVSQLLDRRRPAQLGARSFRTRWAARPTSLPG